MRTTLTVVLALAYAVAAFAQPVIGPEAVSDPLGFRLSIPSFAVPAVAMAKDDAGAAIAWTMESASGFNRVYVARLDATGHTFGPIHEIAATGSDAVDAMAPSIAASPTGAGFILAWIEAPRSAFSRVEGFFTQLGSDLKSSAPVALLSVSPTVSSPAIARSGKSAWIAMGGFAWEIRPDGSAAAPLSGGPPPSDMDVGNADAPTLVSSTTSSVTKETGCTCPEGHFPGLIYCPDQCRIFTTTNTYTLQLVPLFGQALTRTYSFTSDVQPAVRSDDRDALLVWFDGNQAAGGNVLAERLGSSQPFVIGSFRPDSGATRADIAADERRYVVVWRVAASPGNHDIAGAVIDSDGTITPLSIATSAADETDPAVISLGGGVFLVGYAKNDGIEQRIAGRFLTFPSRRHAVR